MKEFIFTWSIKNVSLSWLQTGEIINSPSFTADPIQNSSWALQLYPRGIHIGDYLSLYLNREYDSYPESLAVNFELSVISSENSPLHSNTWLESDTSFLAGCLGFGHPRFVRRHEVFHQRKALYLPDDTLTLRCRMWKNEGDANEFGESFGITQLEIERILQVDMIKPEIGKGNNIQINSKVENKAVVSIDILYLKDSIRVEIKPTDVQNMKFSDLNLSFVKKFNKTILYEHVCSWIGAPRKEIWRLPVLAKSQNSGNECLVEDDIELLIEFAYSTGAVTQRLEKHYLQSSGTSEFVSKYIIRAIPSGNLSDCPRITHELWNLYTEHAICDVELKTPTKRFFVHKIALCARSPVFLAMFTGDMKEKKNECIEIEDIAGDILEKFIFFLYTDNFQDHEWGAVIGLYYAADKYQVERLKILCCSYLLNNVDIDNVCELLILADTHHDSDFKRRIDDFIFRNDDKVFISSSWEKFVYEYPFLPAKTMLMRFKNKGEENSAETYDEKLSRLPNVQDDFTAAYHGGILSDVSIKTTSDKFPAHKSVLSASSPKFRKMITEDLNNKLTNIFEVQDLEDGIVSRMLLFLYNDSLGNVQWNTAIQLYHTADVYQIDRLKIKCICFLLENLKSSNASELLLLAHEHQDSKLKSLVKDFILVHDEEVFGSDAWADFSKANSSLAVETMCSKYRKKLPLF